MAYRLGVDIGGTFTDLLLIHERTGSLWRYKAPSTPHQSSEGISRAHGFAPFVIREACGDRHQAPHEANIFDLQAKYAEVVNEADALALVRAQA